MKTRDERRKSVVLVKDDEVLYFTSIYQAGKAINSVCSNITTAAKLGRTVKGYKVYFKEDYDNI